MYKENWIQLKTDSTHARQLMRRKKNCGVKRTGVRGFWGRNSDSHGWTVHRAGIKKREVRWVTILAQCRPPKKQQQPGRRAVANADDRRPCTGSGTSANNARGTPPTPQLASTAGCAGGPTAEDVDKATPYCMTDPSCVWDSCSCTLLAPWLVPLHNTHVRGVRCEKFTFPISLKILEPGSVRNS